MPRGIPVPPEERDINKKLRHIARLTERETKGLCLRCDTPPRDGGKHCAAHTAMIRDCSRRARARRRQVAA